jgi:hypothetical protein
MASSCFENNLALGNKTYQKCASTFMCIRIQYATNVFGKEFGQVSNCRIVLKIVVSVYNL